MALYRFHYYYILCVPAFNIHPWTDPKIVFVKIENHRVKTGFCKSRKKKLDCPI